jgi:alpha-L-fucosidase
MLRRPIRVVEADMATNTHPEAQWFDDAGFGLFVHWGLSNVAGDIEIGWGMVQDKPWADEDGMTGDQEELIDNQVSPEEYFGLAEEFDPGSYDPDRWLSAAREAGVEYAVLTTKHHDGFALWPSEYGEFSTKQYLDGRDLVGEFVDACRRQGLKVGFYFSLPDWHSPEFPRPDTWDDYVASRRDRQVEDVEELLHFENHFKYTKAQVKELVTRYGRIDLLWFDLSIWESSVDHRMGELYNMVRSEQPHIVVNGRQDYTLFGDYDTPENELPDEPMDGWWELCQVWGIPGWSYYEGEEYRDLSWTLDLLSKTVGKGGNLLLNVGPKASGELPEEAYERMAELSEWMSHSGHTVRGVERGPWPARAPVPVTRREGVWYVHVLGEHDGPVAVREVPDPTDVRLVRTGEALDHEFDGDGGGVGTVSFELPADRRASPDEVVALSWPPSHQHLL